MLDIGNVDDAQGNRILIAYPACGDANPPVDQQRRRNLQRKGNPCAARRPHSFLKTGMKGPGDLVPSRRGLERR
jgi:hypothetical protein